MKKNENMIDYSFWYNARTWSTARQTDGHCKYADVL